MLFTKYQIHYFCIINFLESCIDYKKFNFLKKFHDQDNIITILGDMNLIDGTHPLDPNIKNDFENAIIYVYGLNYIEDKKIHSKRSFEVMINFLDNFNYFEDLNAFVIEAKNILKTQNFEHELWKEWTRTLKMLDNKKNEI